MTGTPSGARELRAAEATADAVLIVQTTELIRDRPWIALTNTNCLFKIMTYYYYAPDPRVGGIKR